MMSFRMELEEIKKLRNTAKKHKTTISQFIREAIRYYSLETKENAK